MGRNMERGDRLLNTAPPIPRPATLIAASLSRFTRYRLLCKSAVQTEDGNLPRRAYASRYVY